MATENTQFPAKATPLSTPATVADSRQLWTRPKLRKLDADQARVSGATAAEGGTNS